MKGRNTPAHAGKTENGVYTDAPGKKHPRACGEDIKSFVIRLKRKETPPRMRGRQRTRLSIGS